MGVTIKVNSELIWLALHSSIHILWESNLTIIRAVKAEKDRQTRMPGWAAIRDRYTCSPSHFGPQR